MNFKNIRNIILSALSLALLFGCANVQEPEYTEKDYGYVQFRLYKTASYTKAGEDKVLAYLSDATKIRVTISDGTQTINQSLVLNSSNTDAAEFGLRSDKMKLLAGNYRVVSYILYGKLDEQIYESSPAASPLMTSEFTVQPGGLSVHDLLADTQQRGKIKFTLVKDIVPATKANSKTREYTFDEIKSVDIALRNTQDKVTVLKALPVKFSLHFADNGDPTDGYRTSTAVCDTTLSILAGEYTVDYYVAYDDEKGRSLLERNENVRLAGETVKVVVEDNVTTEADVPVRLNESDAYIKDYYALKAIWEALDGPNWYYSGEDFATGANWDFNKDCDLWGDQPGVSLHSNGRVALINVSDFGFRGVLPADIAKLTELTELYLGTHNDNNQNEFDDQTLVPGTANRFERHKQYLSNKYVPEQMSEPIARALKEHDIVIPEVSMYETKTEDQLIDRATGRGIPQLKDAVVGKLYNGLTAIDPAIWTLDKLERLTVANGRLENFPLKPADMANDKGLVALTDLEIYNCGYLNSPKDALKDMPSLISVNLSQNNQSWSAEEANELLHSFATGKSAKKIQILYMNKSNLTHVDGKVLRNMTSLGLLDLSNNNITEVTAFGPDINLVQLHLNFNQIESLSRGEDGEAFCGMADVETFSVRNNRIKQFPDIFDAKSMYGMASVDFSYNDITKFEGYDEKGLKTTGSKGIYVETLTLSNNPIKVFPHYFKDTNSKTAFINMRGCGLESFADSSFCYDNSVYLTSFDLSYNRLNDLPRDFHAGNIPYLYGLDISYNKFSIFPYEQFDMAGLTVFAIRGQRDDNGDRCLTEWPTGVYQHVGLRGLYLGSNDIRVVNDRISTLCYYLDISDNPNIVFDASDVCYEWQIGMYYLIYDKTQTILNCDLMLQ
jgi:Leucine-rich repeat (LRR) protein